MPATAFGKDFYGIIQAYSPGVIENIKFIFPEVGGMKRKDFEKIYSKPEKTFVEQRSEGQLVLTSYPQRKIEVAFLNDSVMFFELYNEPRPPPHQTTKNKALQQSGV